ncbi:hypothetical protein LINGRAPRIM_LOCUS2709 [Linum grandiflorum]
MWPDSRHCMGGSVGLLYVGMWWSFAS